VAELLIAGAIVWLKPDAAELVGHEQQGRRPAIVVSNAHYQRLVRGLVLVVPLTTRDRGLAHHVSIANPGLTSPSWAMTEQVRAFSVDRIAKVAGFAAPEELAQVLGICRRFLA